MQVELLKDTIVLGGRTRGHTEYTVTVDAGLRDVHGQILAEHVQASFRVEPGEPRLFPEKREMVVLDPARPPEYTVLSTNQPSLRARVYAVTPADWLEYSLWRNSPWRHGGVPPPGRLVLDQLVHPKGTTDEIVETAIDLRPALDREIGHAVVHVVAEKSRRGKFPQDVVV